MLRISETRIEEEKGMKKYDYEKSNTRCDNPPLFSRYGKRLINNVKPLLNGKALFVVPFVFLICILQSCASTPVATRLYPGPPLPRDKVAFLVTTPAPYMQPAKVHIQTVDGIKVEQSKWDGTVMVEVLPGIHIIRADYVSNRDVSYYRRAAVYIHIDAKPGRIYEIDSEDIGMSCRTIVRDITTQFSKLDIQDR